jgi:Raf kinase inhibitor-like YbhB/YbcL family protein
VRYLIALLLFLYSSAAFALNVEISDGNNSYLQEKHVYNGFGCSGGNAIPMISWSDIPEKAKYISVTVCDPDAPTGGGWWHWVITNIPVEKFDGINANNYADIMKSGAVESMTSFGQTGYGGPCPPEGNLAHRYVFKAYALENELSVSPTDQPGLMGFQLNTQAIATASSVLLYGR